MVEVNKWKLMDRESHARDMRNKLEEIKSIINDMEYTISCLEITPRNVTVKEDIDIDLLRIKKQLDKT